MIRTAPRTFFWASFALAVLWLSLITAPRHVSGQELPVTSRAFFSPQTAPVDVAFPDPAPPAFTHPPVAMPVVLGTASAPHYWIISSRCDVQNKRHLHLDDGELDVYQRTPDGQLFHTNIASIQAQLIPGVPVLMCIHGTFVTWQDECLESHQAYQWIRNACPQLPLQVIFFTWPSDGMVTGNLTTDIAIRAKQSEFNGFHVARVLSSVPESCPVSFIGHSLGCRTILSTLHLAGGGAVQGMTYPGHLTPHRYRAVFTAAAVDHDWLNPKERYGCALPRTECIVNLQNRRDLPLAFYPLHRPFAARALARTGLTRRDTRKLGSSSEKIINLDITQTQGHNHLWPGYFRCPEIATAIAPVIYFPGAAQSVDTPASAWPSVPQEEPRLAPPPTPLSPTDFVPAETDAPLSIPPTDDFRQSDPPTSHDDTVPAPPRLVPIEP